MDGGGINADIVKHSNDIENFLLIDNIYNLPFGNKQFKRVVCSHTMEHVDDPDRFDKELRRVGVEVYYIVPPIWDIAAAFNIWEHKWIFLTFNKEHTRLPPYVKLPFSKILHNQFNQQITA
jgi:ubiquinone/menaquinone biosynthesis C-methylase UbiE